MSLGPEYFEDLYARHADPWGFADRWYEQRKRALLLASLPRPRFARAFEPGCSIGVLTAELAPRCDALLATDVAEGALSAARERLVATYDHDVTRAEYCTGYRWDIVLTGDVRTPAEASG